MGYGWTMTRADLHRLVDELPEASLEPAAVLLERAKDPVEARLEAAPWDDEPFTDEERRAVDEALADPRPASPGKRPGGSCSLTEPSYRLELRPEAQKSLRRLGRGDRERLARAIDGLPG